MKRMKKLLAFLLATMLLLTMIPISASAADAKKTSSNGGFEFAYQTGDEQRTLKINLIDPTKSEPVDSLVVTDIRASMRKCELTLIGTFKDTYDVEDITYVKADQTGVTSVSADSCTFWIGFNAGGTNTAQVNVTLAPQFKEPDFEGGEYDTGAVIRYQAYEPALLKLLKVNGVENVNENTEIKSVDFGFVKDYTLGDGEHRFSKAPSGANILPYFEAGLSNVSEKGNPHNIRYLEITYTQNGGEEKTIKVYSGDLRYVNVGGDIYKIEANNDDTSIVAFYNQDGALIGGIWSLYAVRFVTTNNALGTDEMPEAPKYGYDAGDGSFYIFTNWDENPEGGSPFLPNEPVKDDKVVYALKSSSTIAGTEIHVFNEDNKLVDRVLELYNANGGNATSINLDTIKIRVNGSNGVHTNENYWENSWHLDGADQYYLVENSDLSKVEGQRYTNNHVPQDDIQSITVYFTVDGKEENVTIMQGNYEPGNVVVSQVQDNIIQLQVYDRPDDPTKDDIDGDDDDPEVPNLVNEGAVTIDCTTNDEHDDFTYGLIDGTYEFSDVEWIGTSEDGYYYSDITITDASKYVDEYNKTIPDHNLSTDQPEDRIITLIYKDGKWVLALDTTTPVIYQVECETPGGPDDPDPEVPDAPTEEEIITALGNDVIGVKCVNTTAGHEKENYGGLEASNISEITKSDDVCTAKVTITEEEAAEYVKQYNENFEPDVEHRQSGTQNLTATVTLTLADDGKSWAYTGEKPIITIDVTCDGEDPDTGDDDEKPTPPTHEELEKLLGNEVVTVECINNKTPEHGEKKYGLLEGSYDVDLDEDGDTCTITIRAGDYIVEYNEYIDKPDLPHGLVDYDNDRTATITLTRETDGWTLASGETGKVTFEVKCGSKIIHVTDPGEDKWYPVYVEPEDPTDPDQTGVSDLLETDDHIQYLFGYPDDSFGPDRNMTRAEAAQMFYNLLKNKNVDAEPAFDDVPKGAWYATPVNVMAELGIVDGVGDDKFEPNREITRAEFTTMAMRFAKVPSGGVNIFTDVAPSDWFYSYVVNSIQYGWIEGYGDGTFRPDRLITRAEVTTIVNRMLDRQADMAYVIQHRAELNQFTDLTTEHWAYYTIVEATNEHNYKKPTIGEDWTSLK